MALGGDEPHTVSAKCSLRAQRAPSDAAFTLAVLPLTLVVNAILFRFQRRHVFDPLGLTVRRNFAGFLAFVGVYQLLMSPIAVLGYGQELLGARRRWK